MRFEIIKDVMRRWRLRLAQFVATTGTDVRNPGGTCCALGQNILEAALFGRLNADPDGRTVRMDVTAILDDFEYDGLVVRNTEDGCTWVELTDDGAQELARLWGPGRVPPWSGGHYGCQEHGSYEADPGDPSGCPRCALERILRGLNTDPVSWWSRRRLARATR